MVAKSISTDMNRSPAIARKLHVLIVFLSSWHSMISVTTTSPLERNECVNLSEPGTNNVNLAVEIAKCHHSMTDLTLNRKPHGTGHQDLCA